MTYDRSVVSSTNKTDRRDITEILLKHHTSIFVEPSGCKSGDTDFGDIEIGIESVLKRNMIPEKFTILILTVVKTGELYPISILS